MVLPGHLAAGYLVTHSIVAATGAAATLSNTELIWLYIIGILAGDGPDIDLFWFSIVNRFKKSSPESHRDYPTHFPINWLIVCAAIATVGWLVDSTFIVLLAAVILGGSLSHFILDSIEFGIIWLWPFSKKRFALIKIEEVALNARPGSMKHHWMYVTQVYLKRVTFYAEIVVVLIAFFVAFY